MRFVYFGYRAKHSHTIATPRAQTLQQKLGFFDEDLKRPDHDLIMNWTADNAEAIVNSILDFKQFGEEEILRVKKLTFQELNSKWRLNNDAIFKKATATRFISEEEHTIKEDRISFDPVPAREKAQLVKLNWEDPVTSQSKNQRTGYESSKFIIGFIDLKIDFSFTKLNINEGVIDYDKYHHYSPYGARIDQYSSKFTWRQFRVPGTIYVEVKTKIESLGVLFRQLNTYKEYYKGLYLIVCPDDRWKQTIIDQGFLFLKYDRNLFK